MGRGGSVARRVADELVAVLAEQAALEVRQAVLVAELIDLYQTVDGPLLPGCERLVPAGHEGTPHVAEFLATELAPLLRTSIPSASTLISDVADLRHRLPLTWRALHEHRIALWQARHVAHDTGASRLGLEAARLVDRQLAPALGRLPWGRVRRKLAGLIVAADATLAAQRAEALRGERFVRIRHDGDGMSSLMARIPTPGAVLLGSALDALARQAAAEGATGSPDAQRADALVALATPSDATDRSGRLPRPSATVVVHVAPGSTVARGEGDLGPLLAGQVRELLQHARVTVLPVVDQADDPQVDSYEIPAAVRRQVLSRDPFEVFPWSTRRSRGSELDHTVPWKATGPPGQTRPSNLGPLGKRAHRAKTHGGWQVSQLQPGVLEWESPLGYGYTVDRNGTSTRPPLPVGEQARPPSARPDWFHPPPGTSFLVDPAA
ncbi:MAG: DUF222 domain-containing protein [Actinomycetes bacterium]